MSRGTRLLLKGNAMDALPLLEAAAMRDRQDDFQVGRAQEVGVALLMLGQFAKAERHFQGLRERVWNGHTVDSHLIYIGLSRWYRRRFEDAVACFRAALKTGYRRSRGMGTALVMSFASAHKPQMVSVEESRAAIRAALSHISPEDAVFPVARFMLGELDEATCRAETARACSTFVTSLQMHDMALAEFYIGLSHLVSGDRPAYLKALEHLVSYTSYQNPFEEWVISKCELRRLNHRG